MGIRALRQLQIGKEATKGTAVPATAVLLGELEMKSSPTIYRAPEHRGQLAEFSRSVKVANLAELVYTGSATFEQILYLLHMGVLGNVTPTTVDTSARLWTFTPAMTASGVFNSFTIEYGDDVEQWESEFCMAREIEISGAMNEPVKMKGDIFGRKMTACDFTGALTPPTVEDILSQKAKLYIDAETGTIGATEKASQLIAFTYTIKTGLAPKRYADGSLDFSNYNETFKGVDLKMTFAFNANAEVERLLFDGETKRLIRIQATGSKVGAVSALKTLTLDFCGIYTDWATLSERGGEDIVEVTMSAQRGSTYTKLFEVAVQNAVTTLP